MLHPNRVSKAVFLDCAPISYVSEKQWEPPKILQAMRQVDLQAITQRNDANMMLKQSIPDSQMRMFLLTNLIHDAQAWKWRVNLDALQAHVYHIGGFETTSAHKAFEKPVLFLGGQKSFYLSEKYAKTIPDYFLNAEIEFVNNAGHWVHVEQPQAFVQTVRQFLKE